MDLGKTLCKELGCESWCREQGTGMGEAGGTQLSPLE